MDGTSEQLIYDELVAKLLTLHGLPSRQESERADLEAKVRAGLVQAMAEERNVKDLVADARRQIDGLTGRVSRLVARSAAGTAVVLLPAVAQLPRQISEFARAIESAHHDVTTAESSWEWVERAQSASLDRSAAQGDVPTETGGAAQASPPERVKKRRGCAALAGNAALLLAAVILVGR